MEKHVPFKFMNVNSKIQSKWVTKDYFCSYYELYSSASENNYVNCNELLKWTDRLFGQGELY